MKNNFVKKLLIGGFVCVSMVSCTTNSTYQEPGSSSKNVATIILNKNFGADLAKTLVMIPDNSLMFLDIDGKKAGFFQGSSYKVSAGTHRVTVGCTLRGLSYDSRTLTIRAKAGKNYMISLPKSSSAFHVDLTSCRQLSVQER